MHHALLMSVVQTQSNLAHELHGHVGTERSKILHQIVHVDAFDILHGQVVRVVDLIEVVDDDDVGMGKLSGGPSLALKTADRRRVLRDTLFANDLQCYQPAEAVLPSLEDV